MTRADERKSLLMIGLAGTVIAVAGATLGALIGAGSLGVSLDRSSGASLGEATSILLRNLSAGASVVLLGVAATNSSRASIARGLDLLVATVAGLNALALSTVAGALGTGALPRVLPHAGLELAGFACFALAFVRARAGATRAEITPALAAGAAVLLVAALVESFVSGEL